MTEQAPAETEPTSRSVYITGGATRYGQTIIRQLTDAGHSVAAFAATSKEANAVRNCGALPVYGDETDMTSIRHNIKLAGADTVVHLKPQALNIAPFVRREWDTLAAQMQAENEALLEAAAQAEVGFVVLTSFAYLFADTADEPVDETAPAREPGGNPVFAAALAAEQRVMEMGGCVLRVGYLYGDDATDPLRELGAQLRRGLPMLPGKHGVMANWLRETDLPGAVVAATVNQPANAIISVVDGTPTPIYDVLVTFSEETGLKLPPAMPQFMARNVYGSTHLSLLGADVALKNDTAQQTLDWTPEYTDIRASLDDILLTWRATSVKV